MEKTNMSTTLDNELIKKFKKLAIDQGKQYNVLMEEAIEDILLKYALSHKEQPRQRG